MKTTILENVRIVDPSQNLDLVGSVKIAEGKIQAVDKQIKAEAGEERIDATGKVLVPGFVDLHTHLREPGFEHKETIETGTRAAAAGGFTTVCCMANTEPVNDIPAITHYILERARATASVKVLPIGAISKGLQGKELAEIGELKQAGCVAISDDGKTVMDSQLMRIAMEYAFSFDLPVMPHSICANLSEGGAMHEGEVSCRLGLPGIPAEAEDVIVARDILLSQLTGCHLHVAHVSTEGSVELIRQAKRKGLPVTGEAAPHHFTLNDQACEAYDTHAKMCPPLRSEHHRQAVIQGLLDGTLEVIATDHAPHATVDKEIEFDQAAFGILGFETAFSLALRLVDEQGMKFSRLIELMTVNPMKVIRRPFAGLKAGAPADLALLDLDSRWEYRVADSFSKSRNSPFDGWKLKGRVLATWVDGKKVYSIL